MIAGIIIPHVYEKPLAANPQIASNAWMVAAVLSQLDHGLKPKP